MNTTYTLCKRLIELGLIDGLQMKLDTFYAMNRLTMEEYTELSAALLFPAGGSPEEPPAEEGLAQ